MWFTFNHEVWELAEELTERQVLDLIDNYALTWPLPTPPSSLEIRNWLQSYSQRHSLNKRALRQRHAIHPRLRSLPASIYSGRHKIVEQFTATNPEPMASWESFNLHMIRDRLTIMTATEARGIVLPDWDLSRVIDYLNLYRQRAPWRQLDRVVDLIQLLSAGV